MFFFFCCAPQGSSSSRLNQKVSGENQSIANLSKNLSQGEPSHIVLKGKFE